MGLGVKHTRVIKPRDRKGERRYIKIVKPHFQYRFIIHFVGLSILGIVIANAIVFGYYTFRSSYDLSTRFMYQSAVGAPIKRISLLELLGPAMAASVIISAALAAWIGVRYSHRIAGPMYRFEKTFQDIRRGKRVSAVALRKHDEFKDVAGELNKMLAWFWTRLRGK